MAVDALFVIGERTLPYRSHIRNMQGVGRTASLCTINAAIDTVFENFSGPFSRSLIEVKDGSNGVTFRNFEGDYRPLPGSKPLPPLSSGEQAYDVHFENVRCTLGADFTDNKEVVRLQQTLGSLKTSSFTRSSPVPKTFMFVLAGSNKITFDGVEFVAGAGCRTYGRIGGSSAKSPTAANPSSCVLKNLELRGGPAGAAAIFYDVRPDSIPAGGDNRLIDIEVAGGQLKVRSAGPSLLVE
jgi:hypothetical protein